MFNFILQLFKPKTKLQIEIKRVSAALKRYQDELYDMEADFNPDNDCCPDCMYGTDYSNIIDKIKRVKIQLNRLKEKDENIKSSRC